MPSKPGIQDEPYFTNYSLSLVYWTKEGGSGSTNPTTSIMSDRSLYIPHLRAGDSGTYRCVASNDAGNQTATFVLTVNGIH